ncbi:MAG TPA: hypothetical protein VIX87_00910 [Steroidobacteraceae bacterium]
MNLTNLEGLLRSAANPVELLRNSHTGPYVYPIVQSEYSNWRDEQRAWQETCVLFNQSYHMTDMSVEGPDALELLQGLGVNSFEGFGRDKAKQYVVCNHDGYVIGDVIAFGLKDSAFNLVGRPSVHNWVQYQAEAGRFDVKCQRDERAGARRGPIARRSYRYQLQGPNALRVLEKALGAAVPQVKFFNMTRMRIAGREVRALRHGMVGQPGFELFGPWTDGEEIKRALLEAGREFGLRQVGSRAYSSNTLESGWIPSPLPAVYTDPKLKAYREWLPATSYEAVGSLGGSFYSERIADYYLTPYDLGYGPFVRFDHDFIGREALQRMDPKASRRKVTLALDSADVTRAIGTMFDARERAKYIDLPSAVYCTWPYDTVLHQGRHIGISTWCGYSANEGRMLTLAMLEPGYSTPGTEVTFVWGEQNGGSSKPTVERHVQTEIRAVVCPVPYTAAARENYAPGWRTAHS